MVRIFKSGGSQAITINSRELKKNPIPKDQEFICYVYPDHRIMFEPKYAMEMEEIGKSNFSHEAEVLIKCMKGMESRNLANVLSNFKQLYTLKGSYKEKEMIPKVMKGIQELEAAGLFKKTGTHLVRVKETV